MRRALISVTWSLGAVLLLGSLSTFSAENNARDLAKYREEVMEANSAHAAAANAILQGKVPFKDQLADHARALESLNKDIAALFPPGSEVKDSRALPAVWSKRAEFEKAAKDAREKSAAFARAVTANDPQVAARFKELSESCKACHKDFRKQKKQQ